MRVRALEGTVVFVDISGFTKMSERLARLGRVGAEEVTDVVGFVFRQLLGTAYANGGGLIKFGGDALLLFFSGEHHASDGVAAAIGMRRTLSEMGAIDTSAGKVRLRMSVGVHSGEFHFFLVGERHRELLLTGPGASAVVAMEGTADAGEIVVSLDTAAQLPPELLSQPKGDGIRLRRHLRPDEARSYEPDPQHVPPSVDLAECIPVSLRELLLAGHGDPEHRRVTIGFIHYDGLDEMVAARAGRGGGRRAGGVGVGCPGRLRGARRHLPGHRRRPRRRQADPGGRRAHRQPGRRGAHAGGAARAAGRRAAHPDPGRRQHRPGVRGRHRPVLPAHLHRHGRRRQPGRPRDGQGRARPDPGRAERAGRLLGDLRDDRARPVHGQGQDAPGLRIGDRPAAGGEVDRRRARAAHGGTRFRDRRSCSAPSAPRCKERARSSRSSARPGSERRGCWPRCGRWPARCGCCRPAATCTAHRLPTRRCARCCCKPSSWIRTHRARRSCRG